MRLVKTRTYRLECGLKAHEEGFLVSGRVLVWFKARRVGILVDTVVGLGHSVTAASSKTLSIATISKQFYSIMLHITNLSTSQ